jgi:alkanesulfonate monooxygenase SsuD/methylene tetrahydromethanopterin reductase-like flavin-dependent oxidoreductase (luciferase family)
LTLSRVRERFALHRRRLRPIGRKNERYQQMLDELRKLAVFADDAGFDVLATTEHHFHSEGYETSVAPLRLGPSTTATRRQAAGVDVVGAEADRRS